MSKDSRVVIFDEELSIEAYSFKGVVQKFPNHFHDHYVIGFIDSGQRYLCCKDKEYIIENGDMVIFNPRDNHTCEQIDNHALDYKCINISIEEMERIVFEITGEKYLPYFIKQVIYHSDLILLLRDLHFMIMNEEKDFKKEELLLLLIKQLLDDCTEKVCIYESKELSKEVRDVCDFLEENYMRNITLDDLSKVTGVSKYYLLRSFTKQKGISPYSYLETTRINRAKKLLENGVSPIDVALKTGFSHQSHFTNFFKRYIGLTPKQYMNIFTNNN